MLSNPRRTTLACLLTLLAAAAAAQPNGHFDDTTNAGIPAAWLIDGDAALDADVARGGKSLRITHDDPERTTRLSQQIDARELAGDRVVLRGYLRTAELVGGSATLWIRVDGPDGLLFADRMRGRGASGTTDWTLQEVRAPLFPE